MSSLVRRNGDSAARLQQQRLQAGALGQSATSYVAQVHVAHEREANRAEESFPTYTAVSAHPTNQRLEHRLLVVRL